MCVAQYKWKMGTCIELQLLQQSKCQFQTRGNGSLPAGAESHPQQAPTWQHPVPEPNREMLENAEDDPNIYWT